MNPNYDFQIIFEKLDEAKKEFNSEIHYDYDVVNEVDEDIRVLREYIIDEEPVTTFTRA